MINITKRKQISMKINMDEICDNCGRRRGDHYGDPEDSCYGKKNELFEDCSPKIFRESKYK